MAAWKNQKTVLHCAVSRSLTHGRSISSAISKLVHLFTWSWLTHLLGPEGLRSREVHAVIVAQMIVADDTGWLEPCPHKEVHQD